MSLGVITMSHPSHRRLVPLPTKHFCGGSGGSGRTPDRILARIFATTSLDTARLQQTGRIWATPTPARWGRDHGRHGGRTLGVFRCGFPRDGLVALALRRGRRQHNGEGTAREPATSVRKTDDAKKSVTNRAVGVAREVLRRDVTQEQATAAEGSVRAVRRFTYTPEGTGGRRCAAEMLRAWLRSSARRFVFVGHLSRRARAVPLFAFGLPDSPALAVHAVADAAAEVHVVLDVVRRDRPVTGRAPVTASVGGVHLRQALSRQGAGAELTENPVARFRRESHCELR